MYHNWKYSFHIGTSPLSISTGNNRHSEGQDGGEIHLVKRRLEKIQVGVSEISVRTKRPGQRGESSQNYGHTRQGCSVLINQCLAY